VGESDGPFGAVVARMPLKEGVSALREGDRPGFEKVYIAIYVCA